MYKGKEVDKKFIDKLVLLRVQGEDKITQVGAAGLGFSVGMINKVCVVECALAVSV